MENPQIPIQSNDRKIYPMTAELIDRAEANTVKNLEKYLAEERQKRAKSSCQPMQFLHLFHEAYPPCDDYDKNRISYPYSIRIPDKGERIAFGDMLEKDGFECVIHENGYPVIYVNFTLRRFGNAVRAASSSSINRELLDKESFINNLYIPFKTNPTVRALLSNNYAQSAALQLSSSINTLITNANLYNESFFNYEKNVIDGARLQISKSDVTILESSK